MRYEKQTIIDEIIKSIEDIGEIIKSIEDIGEINEPLKELLTACGTVAYKYYLEGYEEGKKCK